MVVAGIEDRKMRVVIAGGGTGGHLFPGIAIAEEFLKRDPGTKVIFIGTKKGIESKWLRTWGYELKEIDIEGVKGRGMKALIKGVYQIPKSMVQSGKILCDFHPDIVVGVGGYASGPAVLTAYFMGFPTAIAEQNAIPGITNKILGQFVHRIFVTYKQTQAFFPRQKVVVSGNPVRTAVMDKPSLQREEKGYWQLLVFGGSQGAEAINQCMMDMMPRLQSIKDKIKILHQTGSKQLNEIMQRYEEFGIDASVKDFIVDMAEAYRMADLVICRAGATSLAEITAAGKASILIPFPFAVNDHQSKNAAVLEAEGAALLLSESELTAEKLFEAMVTLLKDEEKLRHMEQNARKMSRPDAAITIVNHCEELVLRKRQVAQSR